jgi:hypothetical protein
MKIGMNLYSCYVAQARGCKYEEEDDESGRNKQSVPISPDIYLFPIGSPSAGEHKTHMSKKPKLKHQYCLTDIKARSTKPIVHKARCYM